MIRLGLKNQEANDGAWAAHIGHKKSKTASNKSRRRMMASWHLAEAGHASTCVMKVASVKSRRKAKESTMAEVGHVLTLVSHVVIGFVLDNGQ